MTIDLGKEIAPEFLRMWRTNCPARYRVLYGARNTGKSYTFIGKEILHKIMYDANRNVVVFRAVANDIKDSVFSEIKKHLYKTGLIVFFQVKEHDIEIIYKKTGQKILFYGCDRGTAVNSLTFPVGELTDFYFEEAYEIESYEIFRQIDGSLRGEYKTKINANGALIPKQCTFLLNPWSAEGCFIYDVFVKPYMPDTDYAPKVLEEKGYRLYLDFDVILEKGIGIALHQSTYKVNHWRASNYDIIANEAKKKVPLIYMVEFLGMWGVTGETVYPEFDESLILPPSIVNELQFSAYYIGVDTAYSNGEGKILVGNALERAKIHHAYSIQLCGITRNDYKGVEKGTIVAIDEYYYSQEITGIKKTQPQLIEETIDQIQAWFNKYQNNYSLFRRGLYVFVDSGDAGSLGALQTACINRRLNGIMFKPSTKFKINTRIRFERQMMGYKKMRFSSECKNLIRELRNCREAKGMIRADINDHAINAFEYGSAPLYINAKEWDNFKDYK